MSVEDEDAFFSVSVMSLKDGSLSRLAAKTFSGSPTEEEEEREEATLLESPESSLREFL